MSGLFQSLVEFGLKGYDQLQPRDELPLNKQIFLETVLDNNKSLITQERFSQSDLEELRKLVFDKYSKPVFKESIDKYASYLERRLDENKKYKKEKNKDKILYPNVEETYKKHLEAIRAFKKNKLTQDFIDLSSGNLDDVSLYALNRAGISEADKVFNIKPYIQYKDYNINQQAARRVSNNQTTKEQLATLLGQFNFMVDPKTGSLQIKDTYDFNPPTSAFTGQPSTVKNTMGAESIPLGLDMGGSGIYGILRDYAGVKVPPGKGREIFINLNQTGLEPAIK